MNHDASSSGKGHGLLELYFIVRLQGAQLGQTDCQQIVPESLNSKVECKILMIEAGIIFVSGNSRIAKLPPLSRIFLYCSICVILLIRIEQHSDGSQENGTK
jgi:hypothetical protein